MQSAKGLASAKEFREIRTLVGDLMHRRASIYWLDLIVTLLVGYSAAGVYFKSSHWYFQVAGLVVASFALFRSGSFIHEITHFRQGEMTSFVIGWNLLAGIPMLTPSHFYQNHIDHHKSDHYGTVHDGEYLPLWGAGVRQFAMFFAQVPLLPLFVFTRLLLAPLSFVSPGVRNWTLEHASSFVINFRHRLTIPQHAPRKTWAALELACSARAAAMLGVVALGVFPPTRLMQMYVLSMCVLGLNYIRNLAAHHYRNAGDPMSHMEQLDDSVNIEGMPIVTELFFPLHLRYHALHHLLPSMPFHNLHKAHQRLMEELSQSSPYRKTVYRSFFTVVRELWEGRAIEHAAQAEPPRRLAA
jgi:fatty acid desaturase